MMRALCTVCLMAFLGLSCTGGGQPPAEEEVPAVEATPQTEEAVPQPHGAGTFEGRGVVEAFDEASVTIAHEDIPGFMEAMTMNFDILDSSLVDDLEEGTEVEFTVVVREDGSYYIDSIRPVQ